MAIFLVILVLVNFSLDLNHVLIFEESVIYNSKITSLVNNVVFQDLNLSKNWFSSISIVSDVTNY